VGNIDATIIAQAPKFAPYLADMRENIAGALGIAKSQVNIKATTEEGLGFTGQKLGMACHAVCLLEE
jgi:2-C-methyl-D-erythritol 2,4-cyclodiphosphate synthase